MGAIADDIDLGYNKLEEGTPNFGEFGPLCCNGTIALTVDFHSLSLVAPRFLDLDLHLISLSHLLGLIVTFFFWCCDAVEEWLAIQNNN